MRFTGNADLLTLDLALDFDFGIFDKLGDLFRHVGFNALFQLDFFAVGFAGVFIVGSS